MHVFRRLVSGWFSALCFIAVCLPQTAQAATVTVQARLAATTLYLGDSTLLEVRIGGIRNPILPVLQHPNIDITSEGGQSFSNSSISISKGRTSQVEEVGYVARYRLRPRSAGTLTLAPITVTHDGRTYRSAPLTLTVQQPAAQDYLLVEMFTDKPAYALGERITVRLELSLRKLSLRGEVLDVDPFFPDRPPHLHVPWFDGFDDWKTTDLETFVQPLLRRGQSGFHINDYVDQRGLFGRERLQFTLQRRSTSRQGSTGTFDYFTYQLSKEFRPLRAGVYTIPPVQVKAMLPTAIDTNGRSRETENILASSQPLTVEVHPVPMADRPVSFSGAVGRFRLDATATPTALKVGDPLTLTLTVRPEDDSLLETVRPPHLELQDSLRKDFKIHTDPPLVTTTETAKVFTYTLRPLRQDVRAVPPIEMASYDPMSGRFHTVQSASVAIKVEAAQLLDPADIVTTAADTRTSTLGQQLADGLLANYTGNDILIPQQAEIRFTPLLGAVLLLPPLAFVATLLGRAARRRQRRQAHRQRSRHAAATARRALRMLRQQQATEAAVYEGVYRVLIGYVNDKLSLPGAGLTADDMTRLLELRGMEPDVGHRLAAVLHLCDSVRYAPGNLAVAQMTELLDEAEDVIRLCEQRVGL